MDFQQVQTCNILQTFNTKEYGTMNWFHLDWRNGDFNDLELSSVYKMALAAKACLQVSLSATLKLQHLL